jgi:parallel beta-helix repeat protein
MSLRNPTIAAALLASAAIPAAARAADVPLQTAINGAVNGVVNLNPANRYVGSAGFAGTLTINGNGAEIDLAGPGFTSLVVNTGSTLNINNVTIRNGDLGLNCQPGAVATATNVTFVDNISAVGHTGNGGSVTLIGCTIYGASSVQNQGINFGYQCGGNVTLTIDNCTLRDYNVLVQANNATVNIEDSNLLNYLQGVSGSGELSVARTTFTGAGFSAINWDRDLCTAAKADVTMVDSVIDGNAYGLLIDKGWYSVTNCEFRNLTDAITSQGTLGSAQRPAVLRASTVADSDRGVVSNGGGFLNITAQGSDRNVFRNLRTGFDLLAGTEANVDGLDYESVPFNFTGPLDCGLRPRPGAPGPAIALRDGAALTIRNSTVVGGLNSIDAKFNCFVDVANCTFDRPWFSAIITEEGTTGHIRRNVITNCGQDGIFFASPLTGNDNTGIIEENSIDLSGRDRCAGTGIAILDGGSFSVERNAITHSLDVGIVVQGTSAIIRDNQVVDNELSGILLESTSGVTVEENTISYHTRIDQTGIILKGANSNIVIRNNMISDSGFGIAQQGTGSSIQLDRNLVTNMLNNGLLSTGGGIEFRNGALVTAAQTMVSNIGSGTVTVRDSLFWVPNRLGCFANAGRTVEAPGNFWGNPGGPAAAGISNQRTNVGSFASETRFETYYSRDRFLNQTPIVVSFGDTLDAQGTPWFEASLPAATQEQTFLAAMRDRANSAPGFSGDGRFITMWTSPGLARLGNAPVTFTIRGISGASQGSLVRFSPDLASSTAVATGVAAGAGAMAFTLPANALLNGTYAIKAGAVVDTFPTTTNFADDGTDPGWKWQQFVPFRPSPGQEITGERIAGQGFRITLAQTEGVSAIPARVYFGAYEWDYFSSGGPFGYVTPPAGRILRARWTATSNASAGNQVPILRPRLTAANLSLTTEGVFQDPPIPDVAPAVVPVGSPKTIEVWTNTPPHVANGSPAGFLAPFDVYHTEGIGVAGTHVTVQNVTFEAIDPATLTGATQVYQRDFRTQGSGPFDPAVNNPVDPSKLPVVYTEDGNGIGIRPQGAPLEGGVRISFGFFDSGDRTPPVFAIAGGRVYRTTYVLGTTATDRSKVPTSRWRYTVGGTFDFSNETVITSTVPDPNAIPVAGQDVTVTTWTWFPPEVAGKPVIAAFDVYRDRDTQGDEAVFLRSVDVVSFLLP